MWLMKEHNSYAEYALSDIYVERLYTKGIDRWLDNTLSIQHAVAIRYCYSSKSFNFFD